MGTHFHQFYWLSTVKVKIVETTTEFAPQPHGGNGGDNFRVGPQHNGGNNFSVGTHNPMVEMMENMKLTSEYGGNGRNDLSDYFQPFCGTDGDCRTYF